MDEHALVPVADVVDPRGAFHLVELALDADLLKLLDDGLGDGDDDGVVAGGDLGLEAVLIAGFLQQLLGLLHVVLLALDLVIVELGARRCPLVGLQGVAEGQGAHDLVHVDQVADGFTDPDIFEGIRRAVLAGPHVEAEGVVVAGQIGGLGMEAAEVSHLLDQVVILGQLDLDFTGVQRLRRHQGLLIGDGLDAVQQDFALPVVVVALEDPAHVGVELLLLEGAGAHGVLHEPLLTVIVEGLLGGDQDRAAEGVIEQGIPLGEVADAGELVHDFAGLIVLEVGSGQDALLLVVVQIPLDDFGGQLAAVGEVDVVLDLDGPSLRIGVGCDALCQEHLGRAGGIIAAEGLIDVGHLRDRHDAADVVPGAGGGGAADHLQDAALFLLLRRNGSIGGLGLALLFGAGVEGVGVALDLNFSSFVTFGLAGGTAAGDCAEQHYCHEEQCDDFFHVCLLFSLFI